MQRQANVELRIPYAEGRQLWDGIVNVDKEVVAIALVGYARLRNKHLLLLNSVVPVPKSEYLRGYHSRGISWSAKFNVEAIDLAEKTQLGIFVIHSHGPDINFGLSSTDRQDGERLCLAFRTALQNVPHGTVVIGRNGAVDGLVWLPRNKLPLQISVARWVSDSIRSVPSVTPRNRERSNGRMYSRQKILLGERGQLLLSTAKVGVIGLGGGGSHVVQQLALLGVGNLVLVDDDVVEEENRHRLIGSHPADAVKSIKKVEVMRRLVAETNPVVSVEVCAEYFPSEKTIEALKECDVIVGCVDTLRARKEIQTFAWRYLLPYIDIGLLIIPETNEIGRAKIISGQIYALIPGAACLWCSQLITKPSIDKEEGGSGPTYMSGSDQRAQVVSFNGTLASGAVSEVLQILTGFATRQQIPNALQFDGTLGTLLPVRLERKEGCSVCSNELGHGDPAW